MIAITAVLEGILGAPAPAVAATPAISIAEAKSMVKSAMEPFRPAVGRYVLQSFDEAPRQPSDVGAKTPIAVIVGDSRSAPVPGIYSNCIASSDTRTIACDMRLLDDLIDEFSLLYSEDQRRATRTRVLQLVLAHELGHIINKDQSAAYHGTPDGFSIFRYLHYKTELRADAFAVGLIDRYVKDRDLEYGTIVDLASAAVRKSVCPTTFPAPCPCRGQTDATLCSRVPLGPGLVIADNEQLPVTLSGTHPEFVVRFARMLYLARDPKAHSIYSNEAKQVLLRVVVRDEQGKLESTEALFR